MTKSACCYLLTDLPLSTIDYLASMAAQTNRVEEYLTSHGIEFTVHEHPPVQTCEELAQYNIPGLACKNLFLRDQKKTRYLLVVLPAAQQTDLRKLAELVGEKKLSFVNPETMKQKLGVEPGAVSPFGLLNNSQGDVELWIAREVMEAPVVHFHPNRNMASLVLSAATFRRYLGLIPRKFSLLCLLNYVASPFFLG